MIPSTINHLLVSENWTKIYQSYRNADFQSYDFDTLRRTMLNYLQENYPEDFNDYIDSSEYMALVDLIAYLGQNLSFRIDLNARENFLETAQRRDSVLRLASLISYNAKRNQAGNGFLKIMAVSTTDNVIDGNGNSLANRIVTWNDPTNSNWYQQFTTVMNSTMGGNFVFGRPSDSAVINGIQTEQYKINSTNQDIPIYGFSSNISGTQMNFEVVSSTFANSTFVYEEAPKPGNQFAYVYKNDNQGNASANTGFFVHFRQGALSRTSFNITAPVPNDIVGVNVNNINNTDTWLWDIDNQGTYNNLWTQVSSLTGNNIIYNSVSNDIKNIYAVTTRANDQVDLNFADGSFGNLPKGQYTFFYRQSNALTYTIKPQQLSNISITIPYQNKNGQSAQLTILCSLQNTVDNSSGPETTTQIKQKAPQTYYTQNRMITGEDYNIAPLSAGTDILKIKSINRLSSGISKYFDLVDVTGQYSSTNIFADDGIIYKQPVEENFEFSFVNDNEITGAILNQLAPVVRSKEMFNFYLDQYPRITSGNPRFTWNKATLNTNQSTGYFSSQGSALAVGGFTDNNLKYISPGTLIKFIAPNGQYFLPNNNLTFIADDTTKDYIWTKVVSVVGDGFNSGIGNLSNGIGPVTVTGNVPQDATIDQIIPVFDSSLSTALQQTMVSICLTTRNFGLSYNVDTRSWFIVSDNNLDLVNAFSLPFQGDTQSINRDNSWLIAFEWTGLNYRVRYRLLNYIFESVQETSFYVDNTNKNYDFVNDTVIKDRIDVLSINNNPSYISTITTLLNIPFTGSVIVNNTNTQALVTGTFKTNYQASGIVTTSTTTYINLTATAFYTPTVVVSVSTPVVPFTGTTITAAAAGTHFLTFSTLTNYVGADDLGAPTYYAINSGIAGAYSRVLLETYSGTVSIEIEQGLASNISTGSIITFIPITISQTITQSGPTTSLTWPLTGMTVTNITTNAPWSTADNTLYKAVNFSNITATVVAGALTTSGYVTATTSTTFTRAETHQSFSLGKDYPWQIDSAIIEPDGFINPNKVKISFYDTDDNGQINDPDAFDNIVQPFDTSTQTGYEYNFVFFKYLADGVRYILTNDNILSYPNSGFVDTPVNGQLYYFYESDINVVQEWNSSIVDYVLRPEYFAFYGRQGLKFHYIHNSGQERRIDPSKTNLIDIYILTQSYDTAYRTWLATRLGTEPTPPTSSSLEENFAASLEPIKSISDEIVFQPTRYKILFGNLSDTSLQATFKAVRSSSSSASDNDIKTRIISAIETFFSIDYWEFGQSFYFSELSTFVMNQLTPDITNFLIVPNNTGSFGSLYEVACQSNEIFINGATVNDIEVITALTASQLKTSGSIVTSSTGQ